MDSSVWMWILLVSPNPTPTQPIRPTSTPNYPLTSQQFSLTKARRINTTKVLLCLTDTSLYQSNTTKVLLCLTDTSLYIYTCVKHFGMAKIKKKKSITIVSGYRSMWRWRCSRLTSSRAHHVIIDLEYKSKVLRYPPIAQHLYQVWLNSVDRLKS